MSFLSGHAYLMKHAFILLTLILAATLLMVNVLGCFQGLLECERFPGESELEGEVFTRDRHDQPIQRKDVLVMGGIRRAYLTIGVPTLYRYYQGVSAIYIDKAVKSLVRPLSSEERNQLNIIVILTDTDPERRQIMYNTVTEVFYKEILEGLISIVAIPQRYYLPLNDLPTFFNDSRDRVYWRSKQALDYSFAFDYVNTLSEYYLQIEDDVVAEYDYLRKIKEDIRLMNAGIGLVKNSATATPAPGKDPSVPVQPWVVAEYYPSGFIGRLIPSHYLPLLSIYVRTFYYTAPVDLLYPVFTWLIGSEPLPKESLFTHIAKQSSSAGT